MTAAMKGQRLRICAWVFAGFSGTANAELDFEPHAAALYQYESNVYKFSSQVADVTGTDDTADQVQRYTAGLDTAYSWQQQKLYALLEGRRFRYGDFSQLDRDEHAAEIGYKGSILGHTKAELSFSNERRMASFEDRRSTELTIERDRVGRGKLDIAVQPQWHVLLGTHQRQLHSPLPDAPALPQPPPGSAARLASPDFTVDEKAYSIGLQYGIENQEYPEEEAPLLLGVVLEQQTVDFSGVTPQPPPPPGVTPETFEGYRLLSLEGTLVYIISELSELDAKLGATRYTPEASADDSRLDLTGEIGYTRSLSAITEFNVHLFRRISPYVSTGDATADTGASVGLKWEPRLDLLVLANYSWASSSFRDLSGTENSGRGDKAQSATLTVFYPLFRYFGIRVFGTYSDRRSSLSFNDYSDEIVGAELSFRWK